MRSKNLGCCLLVLLVAPCAIGAEPHDPISARLASNPAPARPISFVRDFSPALTKAGCNAGACHGSLQGRGGFRLSLLGFDPDFDHEVLSKASRSGRVVPTAPESKVVEDLYLATLSRRPRTRANGFRPNAAKAK